MLLKHYVEKAYKQSRLTSQADLSPIQHLTGSLRHGRENLVLVYGGSFNPPHRGHIDVLLSGLTPEVGAVGVVILPSEDFHLRHKLANSHPEFFLRMERRADIWASIIPSISKERVWVWMSTWYPFKTFTDTLVELAKEDGYMLAFSHLIGPDNLNKEDPLSILPYELPRVLVSNKARHVAATFSSDGKPEMWNGFGSWYKCLPYGEHEHGDHQAADGQTNPVLWTCGGVDDRYLGKRGYCLQYAEPAATDVNSTGLRRALIQDYRLNQTNLNQLSTEELVLLLAPILVGLEEK